MHAIYELVEDLSELIHEKFAFYLYSYPSKSESSLNIRTDMRDNKFDIQNYTSLIQVNFVQYMYAFKGKCSLLFPAIVMQGKLKRKRNSEIYISSVMKLKKRVRVTTNLNTLVVPSIHRGSQG